MLRLCVDFRKLNEQMPKNQWPLPNIEEIRDDLGGSRVFTTPDLFSGYWQVGLDDSIKDIVCFRCPFGSYRFEVMPFGLQNAPATFQRFMTTITRGLQCVRVYLDDVCAHSRSFDEHLLDLDTTLTLFAKHGLKLNLRKCHFAQPEVELLGHLVSAGGVKCDPRKIDKIKRCSPPSNVSELRSFLGLASYYRCFIR